MDSCFFSDCNSTLTPYLYKIFYVYSFVSLVQFSAVFEGQEHTTKHKMDEVNDKDSGDIYDE